MSSLIVCENLSVNYERHIAVKNVSISIEAGEYVCVVGQNGSGKTTLVKSILGLVNKSSGDIYYNGINKTEIGYLPQQNNIQRDFPASVFEVVLSGCLNSRGFSPFYSRKDKIKTIKNIEKLGMQDLIKKSYRNLSGGQQQRVLLARALCATEKIIILDEPVTGLDPIVTSEFYQIIDKLNKVDGVAVMMVSHDVMMAVKYSNKIIHMDTSCKFCGLTEDYKKTSIYKNMIGGERDA